MALTDVQKGYIAGLIDGEGCISLSPRHSKGRNSLKAKVSICNTNLEALEAVRHLVGGNLMVQTRNSHQPLYTLYWSSKDSISKLLAQILPCLIIKWEKANTMLGWCSQPPRSLMPHPKKKRRS